MAYPQAASVPGKTAENDRLAARLATHYRILNWLWIILTVVQVVSCAGVVAAAWNVYVLQSRWRIPKLMERRDPAVVHMYESDMGGFIAFFLINLVLGGVVGAFLIAYEFFFIRAQVLKNRHLFAGSGYGYASA